MRNAERYTINGEDGLSKQQLGDASGGSDTDTSRADASSAADGARQDERRDSVKKPFRPVSFAKFSVNKSAGSTPTAKVLTEKSIANTCLKRVEVLTVLKRHFLLPTLQLLFNHLRNLV